MNNDYELIKLDMPRAQAVAVDHALIYALEMDPALGPYHRRLLDIVRLRLGAKLNKTAVPVT